jgi:hypothetical protein
MKPLITLSFSILLHCHFASGQHSSSDLRDAGSLGPFPFYVGIGYAHSFDDPDLKRFSHEFSSHYGEGTRQQRLRGFQVNGGASIIPPSFPVAFVLEAKYIYMQRHRSITHNSYTVESQQVSFAIGVRYVLLPQFLTVVQAQAGPVIYRSMRYDLRLDGVRHQVNKSHNSRMFNGLHTLVRISIMDPAGTEGGWGLFAEWGYNFLRRPNGQPLSDAIRKFNSFYPVSQKGCSDYGYFSAGVLLPLAIRVR